MKEEDIKRAAVESEEALRKAALLLQLASQGEADFQKDRVLRQDQALLRIRSRLRNQ